MANPQKENGYTAIANEILDRLIGLGLSGRELETVLFVIRKTYGYHKKVDKISLSQFVEATGMGRSTVCKTINKLVSWGILVKEENYYGLQKNHDAWVVSRRTLGGVLEDTVSHRTMGSVLEDNRGCPGGQQTSVLEDTHKRKKENIQKKLIQKKESTPSQIAKTFFENQEDQSNVIDYLVDKGLPRERAIEEVQKFVMYWTEPNKSGTKQRWQMQKTFEVKRRLVTWMRNIRGFNKTQETKGITL